MMIRDMWFWVVVIIMTLGIMIFGLSTWANVVQVASGFALYGFIRHHIGFVKTFEEHLRRRTP